MFKINYFCGKGSGGGHHGLGGDYGVIGGMVPTCKPKPKPDLCRAKYKTISFLVLFLWGLNGTEQIQLLRIHLEILLEVLAFVRYFRNCYEF